MEDKEKYVHKLLEPMKEGIEKFTDDILESAKETDDQERKIALLIYAMAVKSFANSGNWRRHVVMSTRLLKAKAKKDKENEED